MSGKPGHYRLTSDGHKGNTRVFWHQMGKPPVELRGILSASILVGGSVDTVEMVLRVRDVELDLEVYPEGVTITPMEGK